MRGRSSLLVLAIGAACRPDDDEPAEPGELDWSFEEEAEPELELRVLDLAVSPDGDVVAVGIEDTPETRAARIWWLDGAGRQRRTVSLRDDSDALLSAVAVADDGSTFVAGGSFDEERDWNIYVALVTDEGETVWQRTIDGPGSGEDQAVGIAVAGDFVIAAGYWMLEDETTDAVVVAYDRSGTLLWTEVFAGEFGGVDVATEVAMQDSNVAVVGYRTVGADDTDVWVQVLANDGTPRWSATVPSPPGTPDRASAAAFGPDGGLYVAGSVVRPTTTVDAWLGRFDPGGALTWTRTYDGPAMLGDGLNDVAVDERGRVVIGGYEFVRDERWNAWARQLTPDGDPLWTYRAGAPFGGDDVVAAVAITEDTVLLAGSDQTGEAARNGWVRAIGLAP